ncbi:hypothetical protein NQ176_g35 [Zarea fungicola]|uniref:Uncharacterized protein n=1 Tax=Zarea fungicola TaxID=93591 RepID=A0ACC1P0N0_9HYPO|nr:hypothetical protein NQ176_g35 [Lecanicillium fungicola]
MATPKITVYLDTNMADKRDWINENRKLWAKTFNVPIQDELPPNFPAKTLYIMRHLAAVQELDGGDQKRLLQAFDAIFEGYWQRHEETFKPEVFFPILEQVLGRDDAGKVAEAAGSEAKQALLENTGKAFRIGAFGLPWMFANKSGHLYTDVTRSSDATGHGVAVLRLALYATTAMGSQFTHFEQMWSFKNESPLQSCSFHRLPVA